MFSERGEGRGRAGFMIAAIATLSLSGAARAADLSGSGLVKALQMGGYVVVMRHAASPTAPPTAGEAEPDNPTRERQLDATGKATAAAMGVAVATLRIPFGEVWSSPTYRALQTVRLAGLPTPKTAPELGDKGVSMQAAGADQSAWLKAKAAERPRPGVDTLVVTHYPNLTAAFGQTAMGMTDGEELVFRPSAAGPPESIGRIRIEAWPGLAAR